MAGESSRMAEDAPNMAGEGSTISEESSNMAKFREWEAQRIQRAYEAEDWDTVYELTSKALADPFLPLLKRGRYELIMAVVDDSEEHVARAKLHVTEMETVLEQYPEKREDDDEVSQLKAMIAEFEKDM